MNIKLLVHKRGVILSKYAFCCSLAVDQQQLNAPKLNDSHPGNNVHFCLFITLTSKGCTVGPESETRPALLLDNVF